MLSKYLIIVFKNDFTLFIIRELKSSLISSRKMLFLSFLWSIFIHFLFFLTWFFFFLNFRKSTTKFFRLFFSTLSIEEKSIFATRNGKLFQPKSKLYSLILPSVQFVFLRDRRVQERMSSKFSCRFRRNYV